MSLTKVSGDILQTPLNIGVVTATSGNISGDLEVGGNISCAGTITYEDVTNVDSIGVITARSGINATGSVSVVGDINVSGISTLSNVVIGGATTEMVVTGDARITGILTVGTGSVTINGISNRVGVSSNNPRSSLDLSQTTDGVLLPSGTLAQRPTGVEGYMRYNNESKALEIYNGSNWVEIITDYFPTGSVILG